MSTFRVYIYAFPVSPFHDMAIILTLLTCQNYLTGHLLLCGNEIPLVNPDIKSVCIGVTQTGKNRFL